MILTSATWQGGVTLQRLVIGFERDGIQVRALYRSKAGPNPGTVRRRREVQDLVRTGLEHALVALEAGDVADLGTSGFTQREDILGVARPRPDEAGRAAS